jgi:leucyl aminopeptidase (aminopeptidase T)
MPIYDFLRPQMEPRGGGPFLFAYDAIVSGRLVKNTTTNRREISVEQLRLEDEDGDVIEVEIPEAVRSSLG